MVSYHKRWLLADIASVALQDVINNPEKYGAGDFSKEEIYDCFSRWLKRFPGDAKVSMPILDADDVLRSSVGTLDNRSL